MIEPSFLRLSMILIKSLGKVNWYAFWNSSKSGDLDEIISKITIFWYSE
jgi:hypothetical protein